MKQNKKIIADTVKRQQERLLNKLYNELSDLELAIDDKKEQIKLQEKVLETINGTK